jgi:hypothetical protein
MVRDKEKALAAVNRGARSSHLQGNDMHIRRRSHHLLRALREGKRKLACIPYCDRRRIAAGSCSLGGRTQLRLPGTRLVQLRGADDTLRS